MGKANNVTFSYDMNYLEERGNFMNQLVKDFNVIVYGWPIKSFVRSVVLRHLPLYAEDYVHLSPAGHKYVKHGIQRIVSQTQTKRSDEVGSWGEGDICSTWIESGKIPSQGFQTDGEMEKFDDRGKYALEYYKDGHILIDNPFDGPRELALTFMTTGPAPSIYPMTEISFVSSRQVSIILDPTDRFTITLFMSCPQRLLALSILEKINSKSKYLKKVKS